MICESWYYYEKEDNVDPEENPTNLFNITIDKAWPQQ